MKHLVMGTAGHVDHGKTALIKRLTGVDTDRLREEKERGITIELGFASLCLPDGRTLGVVDVPGHERFVRNMVAGAAGIDLVVLVVAADEGVMPQTREHLHICTLLGIQRGFVALTKIDMIDQEWLNLVREDVHAFLRGTFLEGAPVVPVSSRQGSAIGAAMQAAVGFFNQCGESLGFEEIASYLVVGDAASRCEPDAERHELYQDLISRQQYLVDTLHPAGFL